MITIITMELSKKMGVDGELDVHKQIISLIMLAL